MTRGSTTEERAFEAVRLETLQVGSAKIPRLGVLDDLVLAADETAAVRAIDAAAAPLLHFADAIEARGYAPMAAAARRAIHHAGRAAAVLDGQLPQPKGMRPDRLNADALTLLELVYSATFKTAGLLTMEFAPWLSTGHGSDHLVISHGDHPTWLRLGRRNFERIADANRVIVERTAGLLATVSNGDERHAVTPEFVDTVLRATATEVAGTERSEAGTDVRHSPAILKIDYKWGADGGLIVVDLTPAFLGVWFDDVLLDGLAHSGFEPPDRVTPRAVDAVLDLFQSRHGRLPRSVALAVLDQQMMGLWYDDDIAGLEAELHRGLWRRGVGCEGVPILSLAGLEALAVHLDRPDYVPPLLGGGPWSGLPELVVQYSFKVGRALSPRAADRLRAAGVRLIDDPRHSLLSAKELGTTAVIGDGLPVGVRVPEVRPLGTVASFEDDLDVLPGEVWRAADREGGPDAHRWRVVAVKTEKLPRRDVPGDHPTAFIYPLTGPGRRVAERQLPKVVAQLAEAGGGDLRLTLSPVDVEGGFPADDGIRRDIEVRSYVFPTVG